MKPGPHIARPEVERRCQWRKQAGQVAVRDRHALRCAGGPGGEQHIAPLGRLDRHLRIRIAGSRDRGLVAVEVHHRPGVIRKMPEQHRAADEHAGIDRRSHALEPVRRPVRVQRHVGTTRLQHRENRDQQIGTAIQAQAHRHIAGNTERHQPVGETVGCRIDVPVRQPPLAVHDQRRARLAGGQRFESPRQYARFCRLASGRQRVALWLLLAHARGDRAGFAAVRPSTGGLRT